MSNIEPIKNEGIALNNLLIANRVSKMVIEWSSWGGDDGEPNVFGEYVNGQVFSEWTAERQGDERGQWLLQFIQSPQYASISQKILAWGESIEEYWTDEDGGEIRLELNLNNTGSYSGKLIYEDREEKSFNGHFESDTEVDLTMLPDYSAWQQIFAYYRKDLRKNPEAKLTFDIEFWGGGDSGAIEENEFGWNGENKLIQKPNGETVSIMTFIEDFAYSHIESSGIDWYNNSGGGGTMQIELTNGDKPKAIFTLSVNYNEMVLKKVSEIELF